MGQTPESAEQVHRVKGKPGRKPKAVMASFSSQPAVDVHKLESVQVYEAPEPKVAPIVVEPPRTKAQSLAWRIWSGQSPDVPVIERVARIVNGLREQGLDLNITLPHPDAERYLNAHK